MCVNLLVCVLVSVCCVSLDKGCVGRVGAMKEISPTVLKAGYPVSRSFVCLVCCVCDLMCAFVCLFGVGCRLSCLSASLLCWCTMHMCFHLLFLYKSQGNYVI